MEDSECERMKPQIDVLRLYELDKVYENFPSSDV